MQRAVIGLAALLAGTILLWFRKEFAVLCLRDQNRLWGFNFGGQRALSWTAAVVAVVALAFLAAGLLCFLGFGRIK